VRVAASVVAAVLLLRTGAGAQSGGPETQTRAATTVPASPAPKGSTATAAPAASQDDVKVPFKVGETAMYDVKFGVLHVGAATTAVAGVEDIRGRSTWHTTFRIKGGTFFYKVNDVFESWIDRTTFSSLRFYQTQQEGSNDRQKRYEIYPDDTRYVEMDKDPPREHPGVKDPLDDGSFLFFIRTLPLTVGTTYESNRYFRPERNPVTIRVVRKETISVPAGKFDCVVVQPVIKATGIFSENGQAEVWLTDDARHIVVQLKSQLKFGSINLYLKSYKAGT
jgi:hypothetical protein